MKFKDTIRSIALTGLLLAGCNSNSTINPVEQTRTVKTPAEISSEYIKGLSESCYNFRSDIHNHETAYKNLIGDYEEKGKRIRKGYEDINSSLDASLKNVRAEREAIQKRIGTYKEPSADESKDSSDLEGIDLNSLKLEGEANSEDSGEDIPVIIK